MAHPAALHVDSGLLLLADISGYTSFLETVAEAHPDVGTIGGPVPPAYGLMVTLLDVVSEELKPLFTPIQTEGDAVFAIADADTVAQRGDAVLDTIRTAYDSFHTRAQHHRRTQDHECTACVLITSLELKFIAHAGTWVAHRLPDRRYVAGPSVNLAHRLLKNRVTDVTGLRGYLLLTDAALELLGIDPARGVTHAEAYPDAGAVSGIVVSLANGAG